MSFKQFKSNKGFTMIEIVTAVFLISAGIIGTFTVVEKVLSFTIINASRFTAAYLVQEGIEIVKNIKDTNVIRIWDGEAGASWDDHIFCCKDWPHNCAAPPCECGNAPEYDYCEADYQFINPWLYNYSDTFLHIQGGFYKYSAGGAKTKFKRKIYVKRSADNIGTPGIDESEMVTVKVIVEWEQKGKSYQIQAQENLYNWY